MKQTLRTITGLAGLAGLLIGNAALGQNVIQNGGFETGTLTSWLVLNSGNATVQTPDNGPTAPGIYNVYLDNQIAANNLALQQTTAAGSVTAGATVHYSFDLKEANSANGGVLFVHIFDQNAGGGVISQGPGLIGPLLTGAPDGLWHTFSGSFTAVANSDHLTIEFDATTGAATGSIEQMHLDNVILSVPEPTTLSLGALGLFSLLAFRRRQA